MRKWLVKPLRHTICNWRWWVLLPLILVLIPVATLTGLGGWLDERLAPFTNRLMRWMRAS